MFETENIIHATKLLSICGDITNSIIPLFLNNEVITISSGDVSYVYCGKKNPVNLFSDMISNTCEIYPLVNASIQDDYIPIDIIKIYFNDNPDDEDDIYSILVSYKYN